MGRQSNEPNMARVHLRQDDYYQALQYVKRAEYAAEKNKDVQVLEKVYETSAEVYQRLYDFEKSLDYFKRYLKINDSLQLEERRETTENCGATNPAGTF
ncbi:MAG: tetratricopeptide repeat protein [Saprospiraceae bacterium]